MEGTQQNPTSMHLPHQANGGLVLKRERTCHFLRLPRSQSKEEYFYVWVPRAESGRGIETFSLPAFINISIFRLLRLQVWKPKEQGVNS